MTSKSQVRKGCLFLGEILIVISIILKSISLPSRQTNISRKSVTEINVTSSVSSSIQYSLVRNAMEITTVHKSFQMKTHFFFQGTMKMWKSAIHSLNYDKTRKDCVSIICQSCFRHVLFKKFYFISSYRCLDINIYPKEI